MASILLIDDSETVQKLVSSTLASQGHEVSVASDMRRGVKQLREASVDLILMDLNMPEVRGEAGVKLLRQRMQLKTPIIILSGEITQATVLNMRPLGVEGFVAKGEDFGMVLLLEIERVLGDQSGWT